MTEHRQTKPPDTDRPDDPPRSWEEWARAANGDADGGPLPRPQVADAISALIAILEALRRAVPHELQDQLLLTLRALIDWYLERLDGTSRAPQVEDIPID